MFTGIISRKGKVVDVLLQGESGRLIVEAEPWETPYEVGESIAVQGVCLSLAAYQKNQLVFDVLKETFERTNLRDKKKGKYVNLERALKFGDAMGGHLVQGHVDDTGSVDTIISVERDWKIDVICSKNMTDHMIYKGSVAMDGISLTIAALEDGKFSVHIIPMTWEETSVGNLQLNERVNIEIDPIAKHTKRMLEKGMFPEYNLDEILKVKQAPGASLSQQ